jgi:hypothetical protein
MFDYIAKAVGHGLSWLFLIGMAGCMVVIPVAAFQLFSILFQRDRPEEINPALRP